MHRLLNGIRGLHDMVQPKRNSIIGLDITSTAITMLVLSEEDGVVCVEIYGRELLSPNALEAIDAVPNTIKKLIHQLQPNCKQVALALPDAAVISKIIQLDAYLNESELEEFVYLEADKYIPYPLSEIYLDFAIIGPSRHNPSVVDVLIVASRAEQVINQVALVNKAGLQVQSVDVASYAVARATRQLSRDLPAGTLDKTIAVIQLNAQCIHLFVLQNMELIYSRETPLACARLSTDLVALKEYLALQIKHTLHLFYSVSQGVQVVHCVLAGGLANTPGLIGVMQEHIGITLTRANPFSHMTLRNGVDGSKLYQDAPELLVACGLALRNRG
ncbi:type IV pilus assembly protein PilM [Legionella lytica]|uniref:Type IV pilus assembly protein PilM n=1 Tax=Legionella lytica TaxID=96232 RepID=A0ABW8D6C0_9GAMM